MAFTLEYLNTRLIEQLECPVCLETCLSFIYMCVNGHIVCKTCQERIQMCCTCRSPGKPTARCHPLERIATFIKLPCKYAQFGCPLALLKIDMESHLPKCDHAMECYVCHDWRGSVDDLKEHVEQSHPMRYDVMPRNGTKVMPCPDLNSFKARDLAYMFVFDGACFWYESKHVQRTLTSTLRLVGHDEEEASMYYLDVDYECKNSQLKVSHRNEVLTLNALADEGATDISLPRNIVAMSALLGVTLRITIGQKWTRLS